MDNAKEVETQQADDEPSELAKAYGAVWRSNGSSPEASEAYNMLRGIVPKWERMSGIVWAREKWGGLPLMTQATPNPPPDTRPTVAGFVLPWDMAVPNDTGFLDVIDAEGTQVAIVDGNDSFVLGLITDVNAQVARIAALEAALVKVAEMFTGDWGTDFETSEVAATRAILRDLGLAHRLDGNPDKAEQVTA